MTWQRVLLGLAVLGAAAAMVLAGQAYGVPDVRQAVESAGIWAPLLFVLVHGVVSVTPVPRTVFTVSAGALFGPVLGMVLAVAGTTLAALAAFFLVRLVGRRFVERHSHRARVAWVRARLERRGLISVLSLRLIPMVPFPALNYAAGLSGVRALPYLVGTVIGVLPGTIVIVVLGDVATGGTPHPAVLAVSVASGLVGLAGAVVAARRPLPEAPPAG